MPKQACAHPYSRIRRAFICSDCGSEVLASHILGDPIKGITGEALSPVGWGDKDLDGTGTGLVNGGDPPVEQLPCPHGRASFRFCPHCVGF